MTTHDLLALIVSGMCANKLQMELLKLRGKASKIPKKKRCGLGLNRVDSVSNFGLTQIKFVWFEFELSLK